eukprot:CAMPEP_0170767842 /NCGR_PEP_ID=MMETSP0733-20121128/6010_1 /TAXON_ID=186038 /ORGANISM="Fragilariopsis kerguelensis, Strain L26-C5" /LENGTH=78 /DNA_ID=CAMNT_0011109099 /DNA_START=171 /DNA_END=404 /DNA_ORIENTATION=+
MIKKMQIEQLSGKWVGKPSEHDPSRRIKDPGCTGRSDDHGGYNDHGNDDGHGHDKSDDHGAAHAHAYKYASEHAGDSI